MTLAEIDSILADTKSYFEDLQERCLSHEPNTLERLTLDYALSGVKIARLKLLTRRRALERCYEQHAKQNQNDARNAGRD